MWRWANVSDMDWATVGEIALISFLVVGVVVFVVAFVCGVRANGFPEPPIGDEVYWETEFGYRPKLTPPEWVHWAEDPEDPGHPSSRADA